MHVLQRVASADALASRRDASDPAAQPRPLFPLLRVLARVLEDQLPRVRCLQHRLHRFVQQVEVPLAHPKQVARRVLTVGDDQRFAVPVRDRSVEDQRLGQGRESFLPRLQDDDPDRLSRPVQISYSFVQLLLRRVQLQPLHLAALVLDPQALLDVGVGIEDVHQYPLPVPSSSRFTR